MHKRVFLSLSLWLLLVYRPRTALSLWLISINYRRSYCARSIHEKKMVPSSIQATDTHTHTQIKSKIKSSFQSARVQFSRLRLIPIEQRSTGKKRRKRTPVGEKLSRRKLICAINASVARVVASYTCQKFQVAASLLILGQNPRERERERESGSFRNGCFANTRPRPLWRWTWIFSIAPRLSQRGSENYRGCSHNCIKSKLAERCYQPARALATVTPRRRRICRLKDGGGGVARLRFSSRARRRLFGHCECNGAVPPRFHPRSTRTAGCSESIDRSIESRNWRPWSTWTCRSNLCSASNTVNSLLCARFDAFLTFARRGRTGRCSPRLVAFGGSFRVFPCTYSGTCSLHYDARRVWREGNGYLT